MNFFQPLRNLRRQWKRKDNHAAVEKLGYRIVQVNAALQRPLYHLRDPEGNLLNNDGIGYLTTSAARAAAEKFHQERQEKQRKEG